MAPCIDNCWPAIEIGQLLAELSRNLVDPRYVRLACLRAQAVIPDFPPGAMFCRIR